MGKEKKVFSEAAAWSLPVSSPCADWQGDIGPLAKGWSKILLSASKQVGFPCEPCTRWSLQIESYRSLTKKKKYPPLLQNFAMTKKISIIFLRSIYFYG